ncbi:MAG: NADPH-dependent FMN reductase [Flavobacteriaceae bacterium]
MAKILAFAGSNSSTSINFQLVRHTTRLIQGHEIQLLDMSQMPLPIFSEDLEREEGYPHLIERLKTDIDSADGVILSTNEHNSYPSAYTKNVLDWLSRVERNFLGDKPVLLMSTAPGKRGGIGALGALEGMLPRFGGRIAATFSLPVFKDHFDPTSGITDEGLAREHQQALQAFLDILN